MEGGKLLASERCPCLSGESYGECCGRFHPGNGTGKGPATAVALMRSRYSAFAVGLPVYLLQTWWAPTRPEALELDTNLKWRWLDITDTESGGPFDSWGIVEFTAYYRLGSKQGSQQERSEFRRENSSWYYVGEAPR